MTVTGMWLCSQLANFSQFWSKSCHIWDQCKSSEKMLPCMRLGVFTIQELPCKCHNCRRFLRVLANFASGQSHLWMSKKDSEMVTRIEPVHSLFPIFVLKIWGTFCMVTLYNRVATIGENQGIFWPSGKSGNFNIFVKSQGKSGKMIWLRWSKVCPWYYTTPIRSE